MNIKKEREEFEKWYVEKYRGTNLKGSPKRWEEAGEYIADRAEQTWQAWQARANLVKEDAIQNEPTDTQMLNWMISKNARVEHYPFHPIDDKFLVINPYDDVLTSASNPREAIAKAMRGEE